MLAKHFSIIRNYVLSVFSQRDYTFYPRDTLLERILATSLANYEEDSLDGDSFVSQSRSDAYAYSVSH